MSSEKETEYKRVYELASADRRLEGTYTLLNSLARYVAPQSPWPTMEDYMEGRVEGQWNAREDVLLSRNICDSFTLIIEHKFGEAGGADIERERYSKPYRRSEDA